MKEVIFVQGKTTALLKLSKMFLVYLENSNRKFMIDFMDSFSLCIFNENS